MKILLLCIGMLVLGANVNGPQGGTRLSVSADTRQMVGNNLMLRGNVRITSMPSGEFLTSDEATITTHRDGTGQVTVRGEVRLTF